MFAVQQAVLFLSVGLVYPNESMTDSAVDGCIHLADRSEGSVAFGSICSGSAAAGLFASLGLCMPGGANQ